MTKSNKYEGYSVKDFLLDQEFILEVKQRNSQEWEEFLKIHGSASNMNEAKKVIELLSVKEEPPLDAFRKAKLWEQINNFSNSSKKPRSIYLYRTAAAAIIFGALLIAGWYWNENKQNKWYFESADASGKPEIGQPTLILSDGNQVTLQSQQAEVTVMENEKAIRIGNDQLIPVRENPLQDATKEEELNKVIVPYGEETSLQLADGTKVWLNAGSKIAFPTHFTGDIRKVHLEGEAYFEVAKNSKKLFIVSTHNVDIKVYGTKFNISAYRNDNFTEAVLLEGSISVLENQALFKKETQMVPGQKATYSIQHKNITLEKIETPELYTSWREGWYQFSDVDLTYVTHKLERFYNVQFEFDDEIVQNSSRISGKLELKKSLDEVLSVLAKVSNTNYQRLENKIILSNQN